MSADDLPSTRAPAPAHAGRPGGAGVGRSALFLLVVAVGAGAAMALAYGRDSGVALVAMLLLAGAGVLALSHVLVRHRARLGSLTRQFQLGVGLAVGVAFVGIGVVALAMFISGHDLFTMALLLLFAGALAVYCASLVATEVMRDIESLRQTVGAIGDGRRDVRATTGARDELADLASAANRMTAQLSEAEAACATTSAARRDLIAAVSHDLRTPLSSLQALAEAVDDEIVDDAGRRRYLAQMSIHIRSLGALVDDLFELSRLEAGEVQWSMEQVHLDELVHEAVEAMEAQASARGVAVTARVSPDTAPARANPEKLQRVLFNLTQNAIHHTPPDGSVTVLAESGDGSVEVEVADTGEGIAAAERERIFEPFYRGGADSARTRAGAGLGLTICRAIVEAHGGRIWLAESVEGARVRFSLPAA